MEGGGRPGDYKIDISGDVVDADTAIITASVRRRNNRPFVLKKLRVGVWVPLVDIHGVWTGYADRAQTNRIVWRHESVVSSNTGFPFVLLMSRSGVNRLAFGLLDQVPETRMIYSMEEVGAGYRVWFERPLVEDPPACTEYEDRIYISRRAEPWYRAVAAYTETSDVAAGIVPIQVPDGAREPVYCTWYAIHHDATADWVERQMKVASDLGFKTLIVDDGWFFDGDGDWGGYARTGDWRVAESKFPDLAEHVKRGQAMGVNYLLWIAPFMVGVKSENFRSLSRLLHPHDHGSFKCLCPRNLDAQEHIVRVMKGLMTDYGLDGFKMDFIDAVDPAPCPGGHSHEFETQGEGMDAALGRIRSELSAVNPNVLLEFRQGYANLACRAHCTMFRAGDAPMDFDTNLWRITMIRSYARTFPVHFDPAYWHSAESEEGVARHMICSVFCVPMLSVDFEKLPPEHLRIIGRWIDFYHRNKEIINFGEFEPEISNATIETVTVHDDNRAIVGLFRDSAVPAAPEGIRRVQVLNASNSPSLMASGEYSGWAYEVESRFADILENGRIGKDRVDVPIGGMLKLQRAE